jgi:hypothetical protein
MQRTPKMTFHIRRFPAIRCCKKLGDRYQMWLKTTRVAEMRFVSVEMAPRYFFEPRSRCVSLGID